MRLKRSFFVSDTNEVAKNLLGKKIVRILDNREGIEAVITETEAYHGFEDKASHASRKKTERNKVMFDKGGLIYIYLIYGMHWCLNFVTMKEKFPAAVLIRAIAIRDPNDKSQFLAINGPGRVCKFLQIDKAFYGEDLVDSKKIWIKDGIDIKKSNIIASKRVGVDYARESRDWEWNYKININKLII